MMMKRFNNKGFSLLEIGIVLTIVGLLVGAIWIAVATVYKNNKTNALTNDITQAIQNARTLFASQPHNVSTSNFTTSSAAAAGVFPSDMMTPTTGVLVTPFSTQAKSTDVTASSATVGTNPRMKYTFIHLPSSACAQVLLNLGSANNISKFGITALYGGVSGTTAVTMPTTGTSLTADAAATACKPASTGALVGVGVTFNIF